MRPAQSWSGSGPGPHPRNARGFGGSRERRSRRRRCTALPPWAGFSRRRRSKAGAVRENRFQPEPLQIRPRDVRGPGQARSNRELRRVAIHQSRQGLNPRTGCEPFRLCIPHTAADANLSRLKRTTFQCQEVHPEVGRSRSQAAPAEPLYLRTPPRFTTQDSGTHPNGSSNASSRLIIRQSFESKRIEPFTVALSAPGARVLGIHRARSGPMQP
jgi:hypothetical protein